MNMLKNNLWQHFIPQHLLSRLVGLLANCEFDPLKNFLIEKFIAHYAVDLSDAVIQNPREFETFNDFFTRALKPEARPIDVNPRSLVSPADGALSEWGIIHEKQLLQAKGKPYSLNALLANRVDLVDLFQEGTYATVYLAPKDYHRVHIPLAGKLIQMIHVPGRLFSVNQKTTETISDIFARNERVICLFETAAGPMAVILVGAMIVASIATTWQGQVTPVPREIQTWKYEAQTIQLDKGAEMGRFYLGSTVILLFPKDVIEWQQHLVVGQPLKMGQALGMI
jgi:phosphatidylserine decarboxylase